MIVKVMKPYGMSVLFILALLTGCKAELPVNKFVSGSFEQIKQQHRGSPSIVLFWSQDCAYCMKELTFLGKELKNYPHIKLVTVSTDLFLDDTLVQEQMTSHNIDNVDAWVFSEAIAQKLYYDVEPRWRGQLPFMYLSDSNGIDKYKSGYMKEQDFLIWLQNVK